ncbi:MAG: NADH:flavin oxidoreductase/NADH oxidase [Methylobacteriaceae bacterium]|jgi:2,4-dienoyl-CoA reductase-like NADH-dependent reductase (Old Yellow Enzyme family)|nr:NADH:flavin oxidoreductase/NADH oxidase [Methylobacteriaceae bacterium]
MSTLFSPISFGSVELPNRIVIPPMCQYSAENGVAGDWALMHFAAMTQSGAGLFIIEATAVEPRGRITNWDLGLWNDEQGEVLGKTIERVRAFSQTPIGIQLQHSGRKGSGDRPWLGGRQLTADDPNGWQVVSASDIAYEADGQTPEALTKDGIAEIVGQFAAAARRAVAAGVQVIELHGAHGYLLHQFLSPLSNHRDDEYGGSFENRTRALLEVFRAVKAAIPASVPLGVRISATDWADGGWDLEQSIALAGVLADNGCDFLDVSSGGLVVGQKLPPLAPGYQVYLAEAIKKQVSYPVITVGLITDPNHAEDILNAEQADAVAIGRGMMFNTHWPWQAALELGATVAAPPQYLRAAPHGKKVFG